MKKANTASAVIGILISIYAIAVTFTFKQFKNVPIGPEFFPRFVAIGLLVSSVFLLVFSLRDGSKEKAPTLSLRDKGIQRMLVAVGVVLVYVAVWKYVGFLLATPFLMFGLMWLLNLRNYKLMVILSLTFGTAVFFLFKLLLGIELPLGLLKPLF